MKKIFFCVLFVIMVSSCRAIGAVTPIQLAEPESKITNSSISGRLPLATDIPLNNTQTTTVYPIEDNASSAYPISPKEDISPNLPLGPDFQIDLPVKTGTKMVTGNGPAGVPILLLDMNLVDTIYSETTIGSDGRFVFNIPTGLPAGISVGIKLGDISDTNLNPTDFIYNPNYVDRYMLGILFDVASVEN